MSVKDVFTRIHLNNAWGGIDTSNGRGSDDVATVNIRAKIPKLVKTFEINSVLDYGCGIIRWQEGLFPNYTGYDVCSEVVAKNKSCGHNCFETLPLGPFDLVICRDVLVHLPFNYIDVAINMLKHKAKYILCTDFPDVKNVDCTIGEWRPLNMHIWLGHSLYRIPEYHEGKTLALFSGLL